MADTVKANALRKGMYVRFNGEICSVMSTLHLTPGNLRALVQTKLRSLVSGNQLEHRFRSEDQVERIHLDEVEYEFLYRDGDDFHFMNMRNYEQVHLDKEALDDKVGYLTPNLRLTVVAHEGRPVDITLPLTVDLKVVDTAPEIKGATASAQRKPAVTDTGLTIQVPSFIGPGETVTVDTETGGYVSRAKG